MVTEQACGEIQCDLIFVFSKHTLGKALKKKKVQVTKVGMRKLYTHAILKKRKYW